MNSLSASLKGVGYLLSLSLISRIFSFSLNLWLAQKTSLEILGQVLQLNLLSSFILFVCRENSRLALMRPLPNKAGLKRAIKASDQEWEMDEHALRVNFSWLPLIFGILVIRVVLLYYKIYDHSSIVFIGWGYWMGVIIELAIEPCAVYAQKNLLYKIKASAEGSSLLIKCITTLYLFPDLSSNGNGHDRHDGHDGLGAYGMAEIVGALWLFASYVFLLSRHVGKDSNLYDFWKSFLPSRSPVTGRFFDPYYSSVAFSFWAQSILKHVLTVGDKILLVYMNVPLKETGLYSLVSDLGSLVARILFQPLEEIFRNYFSKELTLTVSEQVLESTRVLLTLLLKLHVLLGSYFVFFGPFFTKLLLETLYRQDKATDEAAFVLSVYCFYIPFMGINGITEAFLQGVGDANIIRKQSFALLFFWIAFVATFLSTYSFIGISALILANIVNLSLRIIFAYLYFSNSFYKDKFKISDILPRPLVWISFISSAIILTPSLPKFQHLGIGIICGLLTLLIIIITQGQELRNSFQILQQSMKTE